jgi:hypothetical protein
MRKMEPSFSIDSIQKKKIERTGFLPDDSAIQSMKDGVKKRSTRKYPRRFHP